MPIKIYQLDSRAVRVVFIAVGLTAALSAFFVAKWGFAHTAATQSDLVQVAALAADLAPDDPQTHYALAALSEKTFSAEDQAKALKEFELAVSLSPNNYLFWLDLGRARERSGDRTGAELALRKALELAPNYSRVQWALGNTLLRQGKSDEAFDEIRKAVAGDIAYTNAATTTAWQILDGDIVAVRKAIGDSPRSNGALAILLTGQKRLDEAFAIWERLPAEEKTTTLKETGQTLYRQFIEAGKYRFASSVGRQIGIIENGGESIGDVANGGFEAAVSEQNSSIFTWQIGDGSNPRIGPADGQKHSGNYSLLISFGQAGKGIRQVSQTVAVEPGRNYALEFFYRSDLKTQSKLKWQIVTAATGKAIADTSTLAVAADWTRVGAGFAVPADVDGLTIRFAVDGCDPATCSISGNIWFDDFSLKVQ